ncbi:TPA: hypothetical protein ACH3X3_000748 [Trebouxia sp. C0006]
MPGDSDTDGSPSRAQTFRGLAGAGLNRRRDRRTSNNADQGGSTMQYQIHESHQQASPAYLLPDVARTAKAVAQAGASRASVGNQQTPTTRGSEHAPNNDATADATYMILLTISMAVVLARVAASPPPVSIGTALLERETRSRLRAVLQAGSGFALFVNGILNATQQDAQATARSLEQMLQQVCGQAVDVELVYNPTFATGNEFWIHIKEGVRALWQRKPVLLLLVAYLATCCWLSDNWASAMYTLVIHVRMMIKVCCLERAAAAAPASRSAVDNLVDAILQFLLANPDLPLFIFTHSHGNAVVEGALIRIQSSLETLPVNIHVVSMGSPIYVTEHSDITCWHLHHEYDLVWGLGEPAEITSGSTVPANQLTLQGGCPPDFNPAEPLPAHDMRVYISGLLQLALP